MVAFQYSVPCPGCPVQSRFSRLGRGVLSSPRRCPRIRFPCFAEPDDLQSNHHQRTGRDREDKNLQEQSENTISVSSSGYLISHKPRPLRALVHHLCPVRQNLEGGFSGVSSQSIDSSCKENGSGCEARRIGQRWMSERFCRKVFYFVAECQ
jgi:hypothetical protein